MGQIKNTDKYPYDLQISGDESVIGSDFNEQGKTKNYKLSSLAAYFTQYFNSQNQTVSLQGEISGGDGVAVVSTTAQPSIISNRPLTTNLSLDNMFLYLDNGVLSKISWSTIKEVIDEEGGYTPPIYTPINLNGTGLQFLSNLTTNQFGHTVGASLRTIPDATVSEKGVIRIAQPSEYFNNSATNIAIPPDAIKGFLPSESVNGTPKKLAVFNTSNSVSDSILTQESTTIGIGITPNPSAETLQINGYTKASGYRNNNNTSNKVLTSDGNDASGSDNILIDSGSIDLKTLDLRTGGGAYTIPSTRAKLVYITYDGTSTSSDSITLPLTPIIGQRIYIMHESLPSSGTILINTPSTQIEFEPFTVYIFYYNGSKWIVMGKFSIDIL